MRLKYYSDINAIYNGLYIGLEVKSSEGKQSPDQKIIQAEIERAGGLYYIVRSVDDVEKIINELAK